MGEFDSCVIRQDINQVKILLKIFPELIRHRDYCGTPAMHKAGKQGAWEIVDHLIDFGSWLDSRDVQGDTILHLACRARNVEIIKHLVNAKCETDIVNNAGHTALHEAALWGNREMVKWMLLNIYDPAGELYGVNEVEEARLDDYAQKCIAGSLLEEGNFKRIVDEYAKLHIDVRTQVALHDPAMVFVPDKDEQDDDIEEQEGASAYARWALGHSILRLI